MPKAQTEKLDGKDDRSRQKRFVDDEVAVDYPPLDSDYLIGVFFDVGPALPSGFGPVPLTHLELRCYQDNIGIQLSPWEVRTLRHLSIEYIAEMRRAEEPNCEPPYVDESLTQFRRTVVARRTRIALREL